MTPRERRLSILVGCFLGTFVVLGGAYFLVWEPIAQTKRATDALDDDNYKKQSQLDQIRKDRKELETALKRSLPADPELARAEYDAVINRVLRDARVPVTAISVRHKPVDARTAPEIAPKVPAYTRVALEVTLKPIDHATLIDVLHRYYRLNLLQQISKLTVKKLEGGAASRRRVAASASSYLADKADLEVILVTEAIILDGAENRRTLLSLPPAFGAIAGGTPHAIPEPARALTPQQLAPVLAEGRDYSLMLVQDVYHGPPVTQPTSPPAVAPPKEDTSPFIRLTGVGRNSDGTGTAFIEDIASKQEYAIELKRKAGKLTAEVTKFYYTLKGTKKSYEPEPVLDISEASSGTARKFRVVGLDGDTLVLAEANSPDAPKAEAVKVEVKGPDRFGPRKSGPPAKVPPTAALVGGAALAGPPERILVWKHGEPLSKVQALAPGEAEKAVQRATADPTAPAVPTADPTVPVAAPTPRDVNAVAPGPAAGATPSGQ